MRSLRYYRRIASLDPQRDAAEIYYLMTGFEFTWEIARALEFALLRTFAAPSVAAILHKAGEFERDAQRRYDDTRIVIERFVRFGFASQAGGESIARLNRIHGHYAIPNDDYLYLLYTFVCVPNAWLAKYAWRALHENERQGAFHFWRNVGERMHIQDIPATLDELQAFGDAYEAKHFRLTDANRAVAESTVRLFVGWYPAALAPILRRIVVATMDDPMREALGYAPVGRFWVALVDRALRFRAFAMRFRPAKRRPAFETDRFIQSYPNGYTLRDIGPPSMLEELNR